MKDLLVLLGHLQVRVYNTCLKDFCPNSASVTCRRGDQWQTQAHAGGGGTCHLEQVVSFTTWVQGSTCPTLDLSSLPPRASTCAPDFEGADDTLCLFRAGESLVKQDSKQVQVDLQDLGYETCGRSENEAEREDSTSPGKSVSVGTLPSPEPAFVCRCLWPAPHLMSGRAEGVL